MALEFVADQKNFWLMPASVWAVPSGASLTIAGLINRRTASEFSIGCLINSSDPDNYLMDLRVRGAGTVRAAVNGDGGNILFATTASGLATDTWGLVSCTIDPTLGLSSYLNGTGVATTAGARTFSGLDAFCIGARAGGGNPFYSNIYLGGIGFWNASFADQTEMDAFHAALGTACASGVGFHEWCLAGDGTLNYGPAGDCNLIRFAGMMMGSTPTGTISSNQLEDWVVQRPYQQWGVNSTDGTLTTRTSDTAGEVTAAGHLITTGTTIDLTWAGGSRTGVTAGTVAGDVIPFSGGTGDVLPVVSTAITVAGLVQDGGIFNAIADPAEVTRSFKTIVTVPASFDDRMRQVLVNTDIPSEVPADLLKTNSGPLQIARRVKGYFETPAYSDAEQEAINIHNQYKNWCDDPAGDLSHPAIPYDEGYLILQNWGLSGGQADKNDDWDNTTENQVPGMTDGAVGEEDHAPAVIQYLQALFVANSTMPFSFTLEEMRLSRANLVNGRRNWEGFEGGGGMRNYLFACFGDRVAADGDTPAKQLAFMTGLQQLGAYGMYHPFDADTRFGTFIQRHTNLTFLAVTSVAGSGTPADTVIVSPDFVDQASWDGSVYFHEAEHFDALCIGRKLFSRATGKFYEIATVTNGVTVTVTPDLDASDKGANVEFILLSPPVKRFTDMYEVLKLQGYEEIRPQLAGGNPYPLVFIPTFMQEFMQAVVGDYPEVTEAIIQWNTAQVLPAHKASMYEQVAFYLDPDSATITYFDLPGPPTGLTATADGTDTVNVAWTLPAETGGSPVTQIRIERESPIGGGFTTLDTIGVTTTYEDSGLDPDTEYNYRAYAITDIGESEASNEDDATTESAITAPDPPIGLAATAISGTEIVLEWIAGADGGSAITGYKIERESPVGGGYATIVPDTGTAATTYTDTGLDPEVEYRYRVSAINAVGTSDPSSPASAVTVIEGSVPIGAVFTGENLMFNDSTGPRPGKPGVSESPRIAPTELDGGGE